VASVDDARVAVAAGADRVELNLALELGGLTPSIGLMRAVRAAVEVPVLAMVRPRSAGFVYGQTDRQVMLQDAKSLLASGADGIVCGCLDEQHAVHTGFWTQLADLVGDSELVFHRAFDIVAEPLPAIDELARLGTRRILTSGRCATALQGAGNLAEWVRYSGSRLELLPASGITADNMALLLEATGCDQVHGSFSRPRSDDAGAVAEDVYRVTCPEKVAAARQVLDRK